jgi:hypothetical protein
MAKKNTSKTKPLATEATEPIKAAKPAKARSVKPVAKPAKENPGTTRLSALDAAAKVLGEAKEAMTCQEMIETMASKSFWSSPGGKTPANTLSAAIRREIHTKGKDARFTLAERGKFARA